MKFQVPQFIETEIKIVGPFTLKQFLWIAGGTSLLFLLNFLLSPTALFFVGIPVVVLSIALAFYKINGMPLFNYIVYAIAYATSPKKFIFTKTDSGETTNGTFDATQFIKSNIQSEDKPTNADHN